MFGGASCYGKVRLRSSTLGRNSVLNDIDGSIRHNIVEDNRKRFMNIQKKGQNNKMCRVTGFRVLWGPKITLASRISRPPVRFTCSIFGVLSTATPINF